MKSSLTPISSVVYSRFFMQLGDGTMNVNPSWALNSTWTSDDGSGDQDTEWIHVSLPIILANETRDGKHRYFVRVFQTGAEWNPADEEVSP